MSYKLGSSTVSSVLLEISWALWTELSMFLSCPSVAQSETIDFQQIFGICGTCIGSIERKHVNIKSPPHMTTATPRATPLASWLHATSDIASQCWTSENTDKKVTGKFSERAKSVYCCWKISATFLFQKISKVLHLTIGDAEFLPHNNLMQPFPVMSPPLAGGLENIFHVSTTAIVCRSQYIHFLNVSHIQTNTWTV